MKRLVILAFFLVMAGVCYADAPIYGYFWMRYTYQNPTTPDVDENEHDFALERGYIRWKKSADPVSFSGTIDVSSKHGATNASDWNFRLKYAQADWKMPYINEYVPDATLIIGLQKVYFGIMDLWEYPVIEKNLEEVEKKTNSADLGVGFYGLIPAGYGEFSIQVFNGNGYSDVTEDNTNKALCGNLSLIPVPGLMLKGSAWYAKTPELIDSVETQVDQNRFAGLAQYKIGPFILIGEVLMTKDHQTDGLGYMGFLEYRVKSHFSMLARYDMWDANADGEDDSHTRMIVGTNYAIAKNLLTQVNYQLKSYEDPQREAEDRVMVQFKYSY